MHTIFHENKHHFRLILYVVVFVVLFAMTIALLSGVSPKQSSPDAMREDNVRGVSFELSVASPRQEYKVGDEIELIVSGDSNGELISGYDVLLAFDPQAGEIITQRSLYDSLEIHPFLNEDYLSITGVKQITDTQPIAVSGEALAAVTIRLNASGTHSFSILSERINERSKMVNAQAEILLPAPSEPITVTVR